MERFQLRRIAIPLIIAILIFVLGVMNSIAEEKKKVSDTTYWFATKTEAIKVNEAKGHIIQISESKGINVGRKELAICRNIYDLVKGNGTLRGYTTLMGFDGKVTRISQTGRKGYHVSFGRRKAHNDSRRHVGCGS